jgi:metallo-beta-lactamase family protein
VIITFHGAARTVTGSRHLIDLPGARVLLECGLYQGTDAFLADYNSRFSFDPATVDAVVLSHAHLDHCGMLPGLVRAGFSGPVFATAPTADLARHIMMDSAGIQESDADYANRRRAPGQKPVTPLYTSDDAAAAGRLLEPVDWQAGFAPATGMEVTMLRAGHILGAAAMRIELADGATKHVLGFSGDLGRYRIPLLEDPTPLEGVRTLIMESTYGDRTHDSPEVAYARLLATARECFQRRGKLLIPSFALGRAQELVFAFHTMFDSGDLPRAPVYLDSPLAAELTSVFRRHSAEYDAESRSFSARDIHSSPLDYPEVRYLSAVAESRALNDAHGPMVIISPSGMLSGGRVRHHLRHVVGDSRNTVLLVSWQAPGTLGRKLVEGAATVRLFGEDVAVRATVDVINGFSAHADRDGLAAFAEAAGSSCERIVLVHGEPRSAEALRDILRSRLAAAVDIPALGDRLELA